MTMSSHPLAATAALALAAVLAAPTAAAQPIESAGVRAMGMAGAFVAVADDTTAVYWNPAALAKGPYFGAVLEQTSGTLDPFGDEGVSDTSARSATLVAVSVPSLGVSYFRSRLVRAPAADAAGASGRNDRGTSASALTSLTAHQLGATILQSLTENVIIATTLKWVRGVAATGPLGAAAGNGERLDQARALTGQTRNAFDLDAGLLAVVGPVRLGLVGRNLRGLTFEAPDGTVLGLEKQVRAGAAVSLNPAVLVAADVDLRKTTDLDGVRRRRLALGTEGRLNASLVVRGGVGFALGGGTRSTVAGGASVAMGRFWLDGQVTRGQHGDHGWSVGIRFQY